MSSEFFVAKYVPDLVRLEPRNIGVVLWSKGQVASRFMPSDLVDFVHNQEEYESWVDYWESLCNGTRTYIPVIGDISTSDSKFMDHLFTTQESNFQLYRAGDLLKPVGKGQIAQAVDYLFQKIVHSREIDDIKQHRVVLQKKCNKLLSDIGVRNREDFEVNKKFPVNFNGFQQHVKVNYALGGNVPHTVIQRVCLAKSELVNNSAWIMNCCKSMNLNNRFALVQKSDIVSDEANEGIELLKTLCKVIDVDDVDTAQEQLSELSV